jgi:hypothetical protein
VPLIVCLFGWGASTKVIQLLLPLTVIFPVSPEKTLDPTFKILLFTLYIVSEAKLLQESPLVVAVIFNKPT